MKTHNQISRGDLSSAVTRALGITQTEGGLERFSETVDVALNPWQQPEWSYLRGETLCAASRSAGLVAGEVGWIAVTNPAGSGILVVVEYAQMRLATAQLEIATEAELLATLGAAILSNSIARDTRGGASPVLLKVPRAVTSSGTDVALTVGRALDRQAAGIPFESLPVVLSPGWGVVVISTAIATAVEACFKWRERKAYPGELI